MTAKEREAYREVVGMMRETDIEVETYDTLQMMDLAAKIANEKLSILQPDKMEVVWDLLPITRGRHERPST